MNEESEVWIYCLYDLDTCKIRYIGRTSNKVEYRLAQHIAKAKYFSKYHPKKKPGHKTNWINSLLNRGKVPGIKILCKVKGWKESHIVEQALIKKYCIKKDLTNKDDRGEGEKNKVISEQQKIQISESLKKFNESHLNPRCKCINVYDLEGNFQGTYSSASEFARKIGSTPQKVAAAAVRSYGRWKVKEYQVRYCDSTIKIDKYKPAAKKSYTSLKKRKSIKVLNIETGEITEFLGQEECLKSLNIDRTSYFKKKRQGEIQIGNFKFIS